MHTELIKCYSYSLYHASQSQALHFTSQRKKHLDLVWKAVWQLG